jgi:hypothetical protein
MIVAMSRKTIMSLEFSTMNSNIKAPHATVATVIIR